MAKLGNSLVFYFKYPAEMDRLYWQPRTTGEEPCADGLEKREEVLAMIRRVGDAACRDVATFLEACALQIEPHLQSIGIATRCRNTLERRWEIRWGLSSKRAPERKFEVGVYIDEQIRAFVPWVWCRGGLRGISGWKRPWRGFTVRNRRCCSRRAMRPIWGRLPRWWVRTTLSSATG